MGRRRYFPSFYSTVQVKCEFVIGTEELRKFHYLGTLIYETDSCVRVNQTKYIEKISEFDIKQDFKDDRELEESIKAQTRSLLGQLQWVATQTRPDIASRVSDSLARVQNEPKVGDVRTANKLVRELRFEKIHTLKFAVEPPLHKCIIKLNTDAF